MGLPDWPRAWGEPPLSAVLKARADCFEVEEILGFEPGGGGEHCYLWLEKRGRNTEEVARALARLAQVRPAAVSFAGLKDRHALTRQWFSVHLPGADDPDWSGLNSDGLTVLNSVRHGRKLRRGAHRGNRFRLTLTGVAGDTAAAEVRLQQLTAGVPNYFGEQRFGREGSNIARALEWFAAGRPRIKREARGRWLSVARSLLFNDVLAARVQRGDWQHALPGELLQLAGSASLFAAAEAAPAELTDRLRSGDIHPTGPLFGRRRGLQPAAAVAALEQEVAAAHPGLLAGLEAAGVEADRRSLRLMPAGLQWCFEGDRLQLSFELPRGCFATAVVRELARYPLL